MPSILIPCYTRVFFVIECAGMELQHNSSAYWHLFYNCGRKFSEIHVTKWLIWHSDLTKFHFSHGSTPDPARKASCSTRPPNWLGTGMPPLHSSPPRYLQCLTTLSTFSTFGKMASFWHQKASAILKQASHLTRVIRTYSRYTDDNANDIKNRPTVGTRWHIVSHLIDRHT